MEKFKKLLEKEILTEEEYQKKKDDLFWQIWKRSLELTVLSSTFFSNSCKNRFKSKKKTIENIKQII